MARSKEHFPFGVLKLTIENSVRASAKDVLQSRDMKSIRCIFGLSIFLVTLVAGTIIYWRFNYYRVWLSVTSPNQKYTVELTGDKGRGGVLYAVVKYNILVNKELVTRDRVCTIQMRVDV